MIALIFYPGRVGINSDAYCINRNNNIIFYDIVAITICLDVGKQGAALQYLIDRLQNLPNPTANQESNSRIVIKKKMSSVHTDLRFFVPVDIPLSRIFTYFRRNR